MHRTETAAPTTSFLAWCFKQLSLIPFPGFLSTYLHRKLQGRRNMAKRARKKSKKWRGLASLYSCCCFSDMCWGLWENANFSFAWSLVLLYKEQIQVVSIQTDSQVEFSSLLVWDNSNNIYFFVGKTLKSDIKISISLCRLMM